MNTIKTIIISALTYYFLSFIGPLAIVLLFIGIWAGLGYIGFRVEKRYSYGGYKLTHGDMFIFMLFGPSWLVCAIMEYSDSWIKELREIKNRAFPKEK
jgi:hypothetical protein